MAAGAAQAQQSDTAAVQGSCSGRVQPMSHDEAIADLEVLAR
jgi:hypothetical protein